MRHGLATILRAAPFALLLAACGPDYTKVASHADWFSPRFLEDGRVGVFQARWNIYEESCIGSCTSTRDVRIHFVVISSSGDSLDTLFEAYSGTDYSEWPPYVTATYLHPYMYYSTGGISAVYNLKTNSHRKLPDVGWSFSRSGRNLSRWNGQHFNLETGVLSENLVPFKNVFVFYYDDVAGRALLFRDRVLSSSDTIGSPKNALYDFGSGILDTSIPWLDPWRMGGPGFPTSRGDYLRHYVRSGPVSVPVKYALTLRDSLDLKSPRYDTIQVSDSPYADDFDLATQSCVSRSGFGIMVRHFDGTIIRNVSAATFFPTLATRSLYYP